MAEDFGEEERKCEGEEARGGTQGHLQERVCELGEGVRRLRPGTGEEGREWEREQCNEPDKKKSPGKKPPAGAPAAGSGVLGGGTSGEGAFGGFGGPGSFGAPAAASGGNPYAGVFPAAAAPKESLPQRMFGSADEDEDEEEEDGGEGTEPEEKEKEQGGTGSDATEKLIEAYYEMVIEMVDATKPTNGAEGKKNHPYDSTQPLKGLPRGMTGPGMGGPKNQMPAPIIIRMGKKEGQEDHDKFMKHFAVKEAIEKAVAENLNPMGNVYRTYETPAERLVAMCGSFGVRLEGKTRTDMTMGCATILGTRYHMLNP